MQSLGRMEYPGRGIVVGRVNTADGREENVVAYFLTGRSAASKARKLVYDGEQHKVLVEPADEKIVNEADRGLLIYPAISVCNGFVAASNGRQTGAIEEKRFAPDNAVALAEAHKIWSYEPDAPHYTPRISALVRGGTAALGIIRRKLVDGNEVRDEEYFGLALGHGEFRAITTYAGKNENPLPPFAGEPIELKISGRTAGEIAEELYAALPEEHRVAVAVVFHDVKTGNASVCVRNK